jgi:integrase
MVRTATTKLHRSLPLEGLRISPSKRRKRVLPDNELRAIWKSAEQQGHPHGTVVQLFILTGQRRTEIASLRRAWINAEERTITLPDWITKNGKDHTFPYGDFVAAILESVPRSNRTDLLFPCRISGERPLSGWSKFKKELNDGVSGWTLHDLRRTFRTNQAKLGTPPHIGERLINHLSAVATDVEQIYDVWTYLPEMRAAVEKHERHVLAVLSTEDAGRKSAA